MLNTVNVIVIANHSHEIDSLRSFPDDDDGNKQAEQHFLEMCQSHLSNFDEYSPDDISAIIDDGLAEGGKNNIMLVHSTE